MNGDRPAQPLPIWLLALCLITLIGPTAGPLLVRGYPAGYDTLPVLLVLLPALLWAFHRGWKGTAFGLAGLLLVAVTVETALARAGHDLGAWALPLLGASCAAFVIGIREHAERRAPAARNRESAPAGKPRRRHRLLAELGR